MFRRFSVDCCNDVVEPCVVAGDFVQGKLWLRLVESEFWCVDPESWELTATALTWAISKNYVLEVGVTNVEARDVVVD